MSKNNKELKYLGVVRYDENVEGAKEYAEKSLRSKILKDFNNEKEIIQELEHLKRFYSHRIESIKIKINSIKNLKPKRVWAGFFSISVKQNDTSSLEEELKYYEEFVYLINRRIDIWSKKSAQSV